MKLEGRMDAAACVVELLTGERPRVGTPGRKVKLVIEKHAVLIEPLKPKDGEAPVLYHRALPMEKLMTAEERKNEGLLAETNLRLAELDRRIGTVEGNQQSALAHELQQAKDNWLDGVHRQIHALEEGTKESIGNLAGGRVTDLEAKVGKLEGQQLERQIVETKEWLTDVENRVGELELGKVLDISIPQRVKVLERICVGDGDPCKAVSLSTLVSMAIETRDRLSVLENPKYQEGWDAADVLIRLTKLEQLADDLNRTTPNIEKVLQLDEEISGVKRQADTDRFSYLSIAGDLKNLKRELGMDVGDEEDRPKGTHSLAGMGIPTTAGLRKRIVRLEEQTGRDVYGLRSRIEVLEDLLVEKKDVDPDMLVCNCPDVEHGNISPLCHIHNKMVEANKRINQEDTVMDLVQVSLTDLLAQIKEISRG
jgi:hypothetical protein